MNDYRIGGLSSASLATRQRPPLQAGPCAYCGAVLIGDFGQAEALDADAEPRLVHHREHGAEGPRFSSPTSQPVASS